MSYGLIYTIPFAAQDNTPCVVEIEKDGYTGSSKELIAGASPFVVDIDDEDFLYTPTRFSTATIRVVGKDYLRNLFSIAYQEYRVTFKRNGVITWCGFIKPELYTQDYTSDTFELELECTSAMSTLEFIDYKQERESKVFVSLWDLLRRCVVMSKARYSSVRVPHVYGKSKGDYDEGNNVLKELTVSEQNFFDEEGKPMKMKEVLEEMCKFLNWTCTDWLGDLYFVDIDDEWRYDEYNVDLAEKTGYVIPLQTEVQDLGFMGTGHKLDILPGYNKATVKCSNYSVGEIKISEDFERLKLLSDIGTVSKLRDGKSTINIKRDVMCPKYLNMRQFIFKNDTLSPVLDLSVYKDHKRADDLLGAIPLRYASYESGFISAAQSYNYEYVIQVRQRGAYKELNDPSRESVFDDHTIVVSAKNEALFFGKGGALSLDMSIKVLQKDEHDYPFGGGLIPTEEGLTYLKDKIKVGIKIGDKYAADVGKGAFSDYKWVDEPSFITLSLDQSRVKNAEGKFGDEFVPIFRTHGVLGKYKEPEGFVMDITENLYGSLEFFICAPVLTEREGQVPYGFLIKDLKLKYCKPLNNENEDSADRLYENVVNGDYINEMDEIEFKISSYNNDGTCYSKVICGDEYLTDNLYSAVEDVLVRPEEHLIRRIIRHYKAPRIKLTQTVKAALEVTPIVRLSDRFLVNKRFINTGGSIDYQIGSFECKMVEI